MGVYIIKLTMVDGGNPLSQEQIPVKYISLIQNSLNGSTTQITITYPKVKNELKQEDFYILYFFIQKMRKLYC